MTFKTQFKEYHKWFVYSFLFFILSHATLAAKKREEAPWPEPEALEVGDRDIECLFHHKFSSGHVFYINNSLQGVIIHPEKGIRATMSFRSQINQKAIDDKSAHSFKFKISKSKFSVDYIAHTKIPKKKFKDKKSNDYILLNQKADMLKVSFSISCSSSKLSYDMKLHALKNHAPWAGIYFYIYDHPEKPTGNIKKYRKDHQKRKSAVHFYFKTAKKKVKPLKMEPLDDAQETWKRYTQKAKITSGALARIEVKNQRTFKKLSFSNIANKKSNDYLSKHYKSGSLARTAFHIRHYNFGNSKNFKSLLINSSHKYSYHSILKGKTIQYKGKIDVK